MTPINYFNRGGVEWATYILKTNRLSDKKDFYKEIYAYNIRTLIKQVDKWNIQQPLNWHYSLVNMSDVPADEKIVSSKNVPGSYIETVK